ncbi:MAG: hypothetical protein A3E88_02660 [Legionellales bacterium RIFCSPHIGHO2_12_FULL_35_11]|nr:MAG: hypothetical protein A3E88_02660 [Legionellales bacterium RIFCSPHIGHO2_12_FULL_35_11]
MIERENEEVLSLNTIFKALFGYQILATQVVISFIKNPSVTKKTKFVHSLLVLICTFLVFYTGACILVSLFSYFSIINLLNLFRPSFYIGLVIGIFLFSLIVSTVSACLLCLKKKAIKEIVKKSYGVFCFSIKSMACVNIIIYSITLAMFAHLLNYGTFCSI